MDLSITRLGSAKPTPAGAGDRADAPRTAGGRDPRRDLLPRGEVAHTKGHKRGFKRGRRGRRA
jgi:hypothetical protein